MMRKILLGMTLVLSLLLTGCSNNTSNLQIIIENNQNKYGIVNRAGETVLDFNYDSITSIKDNYLVSKNGQVGLYNQDGKVLVSLGKYSSMTKLENMIIAVNDDNQTVILTSEGKVLYSEADGDTIIIDELPIVLHNNKYSVLDNNGKALFKGNTEPQYISVIAGKAVLVGYQNSVKIYNFSYLNDDDSSTVGKVSVDVDANQTFSLVGYNAKKGYLISDETTDNDLRISIDGDVSFQLTGQGITDLGFDANGNILATINSQQVIISPKAKTITVLNSYYYSSDYYTQRNENRVYGPQTFYSKESNDVDSVQIYPTVLLTNEKFFPVYVEDTGYQYYNYDGTSEFKGTYQDAEPFNENSQAIVEKDDLYYVINDQGKKISDGYEKIEYLNDGFYLVYTSGNYQVMDENGDIVIDQTFLGAATVTSYQDVSYGVFTKNGVSYIFNLEDDSEIFSASGTYTLDSNGYFVNDSKTIFYALNGDLIYQVS